MVWYVEMGNINMHQVRLGIPSVVEAALLPGLIGWGRTRQLLLLGGTISATEALSWGLVEKVVADEDLDGAVLEWVSEIGRNGPLAVRRQEGFGFEVGGAFAGGWD